MLVFFPMHKHTHAHMRTHGFLEFEALVVMLRVEVKTPLPSSAQESGECVVPAGCTKLGGFIPWKWGGVPQAHFVQRGKAVGQVVAFCQQVKIHCKVPTFTTAPCCSPDIFGSVCSSGLWAVGPGGERKRCQHRVH